MTGRHPSRRTAVLAACCVVAAAAALPARAAVERLEVLGRESFAAGAAFGKAGSYEKLRGRAWFALDPGAPANAAVADLGAAPRGTDGRVRFAADFLVLRPAEAARGNGTLLYEVTNRGSIAMLAQFDDAAPTNDPTSGADAGTGFLLRQGFTLAWSAWATDVARRPGDRRLVLEGPVASEQGGPITGPVAYEFLVDRPTSTARFVGLAGTAYAFARDGAPDAVLTERDRPEGERRPIDRARWSFVLPGRGAPTEVALAGGFVPGRLYELVYTARDPVVVAAGMAAIRDLLSQWRAAPFAGQPPPQRTLVLGISQSGRLIETMLLRGLHVDESGRPVFDGAFIHVAGAGKGGFDHRFAMPTRHMSMLEDHIYPTDYFPFTTGPERESPGGAIQSVLDRARAAGAIPKLFYVNDSSEYWNRAASLIHTDPAGQEDLPPAAEARVYLIAGAQHYLSRQPERGLFANCVDPLNHYRVLRALLLALDRWVRSGAPPPQSAYPRIADGTLVTVAAYAAAFPAIPGFRLPAGNLRPPRLDFGPRFERERIADIVPPRSGAPFATLVPRPDEDGLDQGGIRMPEILVPLGTRTGFNTRAEATGFPWATGRWDGSFVPFPRSEAERSAAGDPRRSLESRYRDRADYEARLRRSAEQTVEAGFLRADEVDALVAEGGAFYDRIIAHDPADRSCRYLSPGR